MRLYVNVTCDIIELLAHTHKFGKKKIYRLYSLHNTESEHKRWGWDAKKIIFILFNTTKYYAEQKTFHYVSIYTATYRNMDRTTCVVKILNMDMEFMHIWKMDMKMEYEICITNFNVCMKFLFFFSVHSFLLGSTFQRHMNQKTENQAFPLPHTICL